MLTALASFTVLYRLISKANCCAVNLLLFLAEYLLFMWFEQQWCFAQFQPWLPNKPISLCCVSRQALFMRFTVMRNVHTALAMVFFNLLLINTDVFLPRILRSKDRSVTRLALFQSHCVKWVCYFVTIALRDIVILVPKVFVVKLPFVYFGWILLSRFMLSWPGFVT